MLVGALCLLPAVLSSPASAWEGSCYDWAKPGQQWTEFKVDMTSTDVAKIGGAGQGFTDNSLWVTLSGAQPADVAKPLSTGNVGTLSFKSSRPVDAVYVRAGHANDRVYLFQPPYPKADNGQLTSQNGTTPIEHVTFCYEQPPATTSTTTSTSVAPTSTTAPTTTVPVATTAPAPTTTRVEVAPNVQTSPSTTVATEVLAAHQTAPVQAQAAQGQLAFTGTRAFPLVLIGGSLLVLGLALVVIERLGFVRRGAHSK
jgi:hypothetical protein